MVDFSAISLKNIIKKDAALVFKPILYKFLLKPSITAQEYSLDAMNAQSISVDFYIDVVSFVQLFKNLTLEWAPATMRDIRKFFLLKLKFIILHFCLQNIMNI